MRDDGSLFVLILMATLATFVIASVFAEQEQDDRLDEVETQVAAR